MKHQNLQNNRLLTSLFFTSLIDEGVSIACVQDAYLFNKRIISLPSSFSCYSSSSLNCHIIISNPHLIHCQSFKTNHSIFINLSIQDKLISIGCLYCPPSGDLEEDLSTIQNSFKHLSDNLIFVGDFNAHSPLWSYPREDQRGRTLVDFTILNQLIILNDPASRPTFELPHIRGWPDVSLSSISMFSQVISWEVQDFPSDNHSLLGDHRPITIDLSLKIPELPRRRYRTKNVPLNPFIHHLKKQWKENPPFPFHDSSLTPMDIDILITNLTDQIIHSANATLKKRKAYYTPKIHWWNQNLRIKRNKLKALYKRTKQPFSTPQDILNFKRERALYQKAINNSKREAWDKFCRAESNPFGKTKQYAFNNFFDSTLQVLPDMNVTPHSRLDVLKFLTSKLFGPSVSVPPLFSVSPSRTQNPFTLSEIRNSIFSFNQNKAPGPDQIDHRMIRALFLNFPDLFLNLFNTLFHSNYFPRAWKVGELVFFKKEGKDPSSYNSYRPITLLPILGKIFEKLILKRIFRFLTTTNPLSGLQHGFIEKRSTETALEALL